MKNTAKLYPVAPRPKPEKEANKAKEYLQLYGINAKLDCVELTEDIRLLTLQLPMRGIFFLFSFRNFSWNRAPRI